MRTIKVWKKVLTGVIMVFLAYGPTPLGGQEAVDEQTPSRQHGDLLTSFSLKWAVTPTTDSAGQATFDPWSLSSSVQSDESTVALQSNILRKLLTEDDIRLLEDLLPVSDGTCAEKTVIGCLVIAGISPSFADVVRHLYNKLVKSGYQEQSSSPEGLPETSGHQREDPKSLVILRFVVKVNSNAVSMETTQDRLRNLTAGELESLLFLPVISSLEESRLSSGLDIETTSLFSENLFHGEHSSASNAISVLATVPPPPDFQPSRKSSFPNLSQSILPNGALSALPILTSSSLPSLSPTQTSYLVISSTEEDYDVASASILFDSWTAEGSASTLHASEHLIVGVEPPSLDSHTEILPDKVQNSLNPSSAELWDYSTLVLLDDLAHRLGIHPRAVLSSSAETVNIFTDSAGSSPEFVSSLTPSNLGTTIQSMALLPNEEENNLVMEIMKVTDSSHQLSTMTSEIHTRSFSNKHDNLNTSGSLTADKSAHGDEGSENHSDSMTVDGEHTTSLSPAPSSAVTEQTFELSSSLSDAIISSPSSSAPQPESDAGLLHGVNRLSTDVSDLSSLTLVPSSARSQVFLDSTRSSQTALSHTQSSGNERLKSTFSTTVVSSSEFAFLQMARLGMMQASSKSVPGLESPYSPSISEPSSSSSSSPPPSLSVLSPSSSLQPPSSPTASVVQTSFLSTSYDVIVNVTTAPHFLAPTKPPLTASVIQSSSGTSGTQDYSKFYFSVPAVHPQSRSITSSFNVEASSHLPASTLDDSALPTSTVRGLPPFSFQEQPSQTQQPFEGSSTTENIGDLAHRLGIHPRAVLSSSAETVNIFTDSAGSSPEFVSPLTPSNLGTTIQSMAPLPNEEENNLVMEMMKVTDSSHQLSTMTSDHTVQSASAFLSGETSFMARTEEITNTRSELSGVTYPTQVLSSNHYSDFPSPDFEVDMTVSDILRATPVTMATLSSLHLYSASSSSLYLQSQQILLSSSLTEQELVSTFSLSDICSPHCSILPTVALDEQTPNFQTPVMTLDQSPTGLDESITTMEQSTSAFLKPTITMDQYPSSFLQPSVTLDQSQSIFSQNAFTVDQSLSIFVKPLITLDQFSSSFVQPSVTLYQSSSFVRPTNNLDQPTYISQSNTLTSNQYPLTSESLQLPNNLDQPASMSHTVALTSNLYPSTLDSLEPSNNLDQLASMSHTVALTSNLYPSTSDNLEPSNNLDQPASMSHTVALASNLYPSTSDNLEPSNNLDQPASMSHTVALASNLYPSTSDSLEPSNNLDQPASMSHTIALTSNLYTSTSDSLEPSNNLDQPASMSHTIALASNLYTSTSYSHEIILSEHLSDSKTTTKILGSNPSPSTSRISNQYSSVSFSSIISDQYLANFVSSTIPMDFYTSRLVNSVSKFDSYPSNSYSPAMNLDKLSELSSVSLAVPLDLLISSSVSLTETSDLFSSSSVPPAVMSSLSPLNFVSQGLFHPSASSPVSKPLQTFSEADLLPRESEVRDVLDTVVFLTSSHTAADMFSSSSSSMLNMPSLSSMLEMNKYTTTEESVEPTQQKTPLLTESPSSVISTPDLSEEILTSASDNSKYFTAPPSETLTAMSSAKGDVREVQSLLSYMPMSIIQRAIVFIGEITEEKFESTLAEGPAKADIASTIAVISPHQSFAVVSASLPISVTPAVSRLDTTALVIGTLTESVQSLTDKSPSLLPDGLETASIQDINWTSTLAATSSSSGPETVPSLSSPSTSSAFLPRPLETTETKTSFTAHTNFGIWSDMFSESSDDGHEYLSNTMFTEESLVIPGEATISDRPLVITDVASLTSTASKSPSDVDRTTVSDFSRGQVSDDVTKEPVSLPTSYPVLAPSNHLDGWQESTRHGSENIRSISFESEVTSVVAPSDLLQQESSSVVASAQQLYEPHETLWKAVEPSEAIFGSLDIAVSKTNTHIEALAPSRSPEEDVSQFPLPELPMEVTSWQNFFTVSASYAPDDEGHIPSGQVLTSDSLTSAALLSIYPTSTQGGNTPSLSLFQTPTHELHTTESRNEVAEPRSLPSILRITILVDRSVNITSLDFKQKVQEALQRLYAQALLARSAGSRVTSGLERHRRQASSQVQTMLTVVDVSRDSQNNSLVTLDFVVGGDSEAGADSTSGSMTTSKLLELLNTFSSSEIANIITYPVLGPVIITNKSISINDPTNSNVVMVTEGDIIIATEYPAPSSTAFFPWTSTTSIVTPTLPWPPDVTSSSQSEILTTAQMSESETVFSSSSLSSWVYNSSSSLLDSLLFLSTISELSSAQWSTTSSDVTTLMSGLYSSPTTSLLFVSDTTIFPSPDITQTVEVASTAASISDTKVPLSSSSSSVLPSLPWSPAATTPATSPTQTLVTPSSLIIFESQSDLMTRTPSGSETVSTPVVTTIKSLSTFESAFSSSRLTEGSSSLADETSLVESSPTAVLSLTAIVTDFTLTTYFVDGESSSRESGFQSTSLFDISAFSSNSDLISSSSVDTISVTLSEFHVTTTQIVSSKFSDTTSGIFTFSFTALTPETDILSSSSNPLFTSYSESSASSLPFEQTPTLTTFGMSPTSSLSLVTSTSSESRNIATSLTPESTIVPSTNTLTTLTHSQAVSSTMSPSSVFPTTLPTSSVPPTPPITSKPPPTTAAPVSQKEAMMVVVLEVKTTENVNSTEFKVKIQKALTLCYLEALQVRRKRSAERLHPGTGRFQRQAASQAAVEVVDVVRNNSDPKITQVSFYVTEDGSYVPSSTATTVFSKFSLSYISAILAYPVLSPIHALSADVAVPQPSSFDTDNTRLFVVAVVLPSLLLLMLLAAVAFIFHRYRRSRTPVVSSADVIPTKYQRGETLDDYNLHVDVERGEIVDRTPRHTPEPPFLREYVPSKYGRPVGVFHKTGDKGLPTSKQQMIDMWLRSEGPPPVGSLESIDSVAKSDTFLYRKKYYGPEFYALQKKKMQQLEAPQEFPYNTYFNGLESTPESYTEDKEETDCEEDKKKKKDQEDADENVDFNDGSMRRYSSPEVPEIKPRRSFVGRLRESFKKKKRNAGTSEYCSNTQSTMLTVLADSSQTLAGSRDTSFSVDRNDEARKRSESNHTDASDEFTVIMPLSRSRPVAKQRDRGKDGSNSPATPDDDRSRRLNSDAEQQEGEDEKDEDCVSEKKMREAFSPHLANADEGEDKLYTCTMETQTSLTSSDDSRGDDVTPEITFKSVAVGPNGVNQKTQTESLPEQDWAYDKRRLPVRSGEVHHNGTHDSAKFALTEQTPQTSMDENDAQDEFLPMRVEPFAKMIKLETQLTEKESTPPVKYRRNLFDGGKTKYDESKPAHHMRAQPPFSSEGLNDQQRRQPESADDILSRQQLLLRQQQEVMAHIHHQQLEQQAQQLVNSALGLSNVTQPPVTNPSSSARERLSALLNDACILAPQAGGMAQVPVTGWMPAQRPLGNQGYGTPANVLGQEELMQAVRRELKRMQQE